MKTSIVLSSADRELFGTIIRQDTKSQFLSVSDLQHSYDKARWQYGWSNRRVDSITKTNDFKERVFYILESQGLIKTTIVGFIDMIAKEGITKVLKGLGVWKTSGTRGNNHVMCNPYIWMLLAMELNPMIYGKVIVWLTDSLIFDRIEAGTEFMPMNRAIKSIVPVPDYPKYAITINNKVFGTHISGMRNIASAPELKKIAKIESFITQAVSMGMIKTESDIINAITGFNII